ncbi:MAG: LysR family transcriptional regulator [Pseudomonadota bacterium]
MDIRRLKLFCEVCRQGSYSLAAKKAGLTQSAVSQQVRALERDLGVALFDADDRSRPTAAGDFLFREGGRLLAQMDDVENGIRHVAGVGAGTVRFGMIDVAAIWLLPGVLTRFKEAYPQVKVEAVVKTSGELIELVERHAIDFAIVVTNRIPDSLVKKDIYEDSIVAVVPRRSHLNRRQISVRDLRGEPLILYPASSYSRMLIDDIFRANGVVPAVSMEMHYPAAILSLVRQGMGVGLVSELSAREMKLRGQAVVRIEELEGKREIGIVSHRGRRPSPQARELVKMIEKLKSSGL